MTATPADNELMELEKQFWEAMKNRDPRTAERLTDDEVLVIGPQGIGEVERSAIGGMIEAAPYRLEQYEMDPSDVHVRMIRDDVAIVAYKVNERMTVDGQPATLDAYDSTVWIRRDGHWVSALHTETIAGDPYGRDRRQ